MAAGKKLSALTELAAGSVDPAADYIPIVDTSETETKKVTPYSLLSDSMEGLTTTGSASTSDKMVWDTPSSGLTGPLHISTVEGNAGGQADGTGNPAICMGYNVRADGQIVTGDFGAMFKIEGHWDEDAPNGDYVLEAYAEFADTSDATYRAQRPFMAKYDESESLIDLCRLGVGTGYAINFAEFDTAAAGTEFARFAVNTTTFTGTAAANHNFQLRAGSGRNMLFSMSCNGDDPGIAASVFMNVAPWGGGADRQALIKMGDGTNQTTGGITYRYETSAGYDAPLVNIGAESSVTTALVSLDHANVPATIKTLEVKARASQTGAVIAVDGIQNGGTVEADKWVLHPKGYIQVKPSAGSQQSPGTGASTITPAWTNKPGASTSGTATWFPMLSTTGALFWLPGFAD